MPKLRRCEACGSALPAPDGITLDDERCIMTRGKLSVRLSKQQTLIARVLMERPGRCVTRAFLEDSIWGLESEGIASNHISVLVAQLRKKLTKINVTISTIWGMGYVWGDQIDKESRHGPNPSYRPAATFAEPPRFRKAS